MAAAPTTEIVESMSKAAEASKQLLAPRGGCSWKCVAQTRRSSGVAEERGIVFAAQVEKSATRPLLLLYGFSSTKFRTWFTCHEPRGLSNTVRSLYSSLPCLRASNRKVQPLASTGIDHRNCDFGVAHLDSGWHSDRVQSYGRGKQQRPPCTNYIPLAVAGPPHSTRGAAAGQPRSTRGRGARSFREWRLLGGPALGGVTQKIM